ncbi:MAG: hypothetical protein JWS12_266 [Candidatus Saccharibacteria bacterium]|nr:hypothetical protein [Candidatus Saccharibacteria bacterium]
MEPRIGQETNFTQLKEEAFRNRATVETESGTYLIVEIPDEDGAIGWMEELHGLGVAQIGQRLIIEADFRHHTRRNRLHDVLSADLTTQAVSHTRYIDGQVSSEPSDPRTAKRLVADYLVEASTGSRLGLMTQLSYEFFTPELQQAAAINHEE